MAGTEAVYVGRGSVGGRRPPSAARRNGSTPTARAAIGEATDAGFRHVVLGLPAPYPAGVARWVADELTARSA